MHPRIHIITLAADDMDRAREFYEHGLRRPVRERPDGTLSVGLGGAASELVLAPWEALAGEAGVSAQSSGFRGFTLSYIVDTADAVDDLLARVESHEGTISKPPKGAVWGYSAYVTDPSGHLWKIASSKRKPLLGRRERAAANGPVEANEVPITIGVADVGRSKEFYRDGLGLPVKKDYRKFVMFDGSENGSGLGLYKREALAADAAVPVAGEGFPGFTLTHVADSPADGESLADRAEQSGGRRLAGGWFADPDGNLWKVAH